MRTLRSVLKSSELKRFLGVTALLGTFLSLLNPALAQIAPSPCDPDYYQSLEERAWLEAQREITQNQNLIFKPDSVLAYTCFHGYLWELGDHADEMFSEGTRWGGSVIDDQALSMNNALAELVAEALGTYLDSNFTSGTDRRYLGGRMDSPRRTAPGIYATVANGRSYTCQVMQTVWNFAKCYNFQAEPRDGFFTFEEYAAGLTGTSQPRALPTACGAEPTAQYTSAIEAAMTNPPWPTDQTLTYMANLEAASCGDAAMLPIATGVIVTRANQSPQRYFEGVCIQPGCHYRPPGGTPSGTPEATGTCGP